MKKKIFSLLIGMGMCFWVSGQNSEDIGYARPTGSSPYGLNINTPTNGTGSGLEAGFTNFQIATRAWSGSHALLFNSYASQTMVPGGLFALGNTKYANNVGSYSSGAGAIMFYGNGGSMDFLISPSSTGADNDINWGTPKMRIQRNGNVGINTSSPTEILHVGGNTLVEGNAIINGNQIRFSEARGFDYDPALDAVFYNGYNNGQVAMLSDRDGNAWFEGNVGIGTTSPQEQFHVNGGNNAIHAKFNGSYSGPQGIQIRRDDGADIKVLANYTSFGGGIQSSSALRFSVNGNSLSDPALYLKTDGNLGIGTTAPTHKLEVNGTIRSKEVKVEASPWPDYVFEPDYNLLSLEEIEAFIKSEKHLPEIPSAKEMEANGLKLGEMNRLLLLKIEELTLHLIEVNKENTELRQQLTANSQGQDKKIEELTTYVMKLTQEIEKLKSE